MKTVCAPVTILQPSHGVKPEDHELLDRWARKRGADIGDGASVGIDFATGPDESRVSVWKEGKLVAVATTETSVFAIGDMYKASRKGFPGFVVREDGDAVQWVRINERLPLMRILYSGKRPSVVIPEELWREA